MTSFLVINQVFLILTLSFQILCVFIVSNVIHDPFFTTKSPLSIKKILDDTYFSSLQAFAPIPQHYTSQNIGGTNAWAVPHLKFWGTVPPSPPRYPPLNLRTVCLFIHPSKLSAFIVGLCVWLHRRRLGGQPGRASPKSGHAHAFISVYHIFPKNFDFPKYFSTPVCVVACICPSFWCVCVYVCAR